MENGHPEALPPRYYLANFHSLAEFVYLTYRDLLSPVELHWYHRLRESSEAAQCLYIRLLTRKGSVFRLSRLDYPELGKLNALAQELSEHKLAEVDSPTSLPVLLAAFTKPELLSLLQLDTGKSLARPALLERILTASQPEQDDYRQRLQQADHWITIYGHEHWNVFKLCFFGNLYQDSTEFVLRDIGAVSYEQYQIDTVSRAFFSRDQLEAHLRYYECQVLLDVASKQDQEHLKRLIALMPAPVDGDANLARRLDRFRNKIARQLERLGEEHQALLLYAESTHPPARERRARLYLKNLELEHANALVDVMLLNPYSEAERHVAERLKKRLLKLQGQSVKPAKPFRPAASNLILKPSSQRVEESARRFYAQLGQCFYTENTLVNGVLGLFIWDIVFLPIKGVFFNPFQSAPADFYDPAFRLRRSDALSARFAEMHEPLRFSARVMTNYTQHYGKSNPLVHWPWLPLNLVSLAIERIPQTHWQGMFDRILSAPRENMTGFPDLVFFGQEEGYEFIEVKGPGDTLQENQRRWMQYFFQHRIPCRVVSVRWRTSDA